MPEDKKPQNEGVELDAIEKEIEASYDETNQSTDQSSPVDPFARLKKKKVARPQTLQPKISGKVKKGKKLSPKLFLIGCAGVFLIFLALVFAGLYYAINSSEFLQGIGLKVEDVKSILLIFAAMFFGLIFFLGFYILVLNIYRLVTVKSRSKIRYVLGLVLGFFVILATIVTGTLSIQKIRSLGGEQQIQTNLLLIPHIETKDGLVNASDGIPLIGPVKIRYQINKPQFDRNVLPAIGGNNTISSFAVECGNGQTLSANQSIYQGQNGGFFNEHCLYVEKGQYTLQLVVNYLNRQTGANESKSFTVTDFTVNAQITIEPEENQSYLNDKLNELIIGVAPISASFKAQLLFSDLGLKNDSIVWDMDGDEQPDLINNANFIYPFGNSKLHTITYNLPELKGFEDIRFLFDLRVLESELARCELQVDNVDNDKRFRFTPKFDELVDAATFNYTIYDKRSDTFVLSNKKESGKTYTHVFEAGGEYEIQTSYFTPEGEKGSCLPKPLTVGFVGNKVDFSTRWRQDELTPFVSAGEWTPVIVDNVNNKILVNILPAILELTIDDIRPDPNAEVRLYYDGRQIFEDRDEVYEVNIGKLGTKEMKFTIITAQGKQEEQLYMVDVARQPVRANIKVEPAVGEDPLEVVLDASISNLYDEDDEIVYFTRDFGDGETRQNVSQGKINHTYRYNDEDDTGEYFPSVTVKTKLGFEDSFTVPTPIIVKKKQRAVLIRVDSHPTRQAKINDIVQFSLETDGRVTSIDWNFWNGQTLWCDDRSCANAPVRYAEAGEYEVRVEVQYDNDVPVTSRTKVRVY